MHKYFKGIPNLNSVADDLVQPYFDLNEQVDSGKITPEEAGIQFRYLVAKEITKNQSDAELSQLLKSNPKGSEYHDALDQILKERRKLKVASKKIVTKWRGH